MDFVFYFFVIIPSAIIHEYAHGWVADRLGDPTARYAGRLTINPKAHIDPFGTIILPILLSLATMGKFSFAYAKPVPYNPHNLKNQKWGPVLVALAGPLANLLLATAFAIVLRFVRVSDFGSILAIIVYANISLAVFNLVPIPPLDGSKILYAVLPNSAYQVRNFLEQYGTWLLLLFIFFFSGALAPIVQLIFLFLVGY